MSEQTKSDHYNPDFSGDQGRDSIDCLDLSGGEEGILQDILDDEHTVQFRRSLGSFLIMLGVVVYLILMFLDSFAEAVRLEFWFFTSEFWRDANLVWFLPTISLVGTGLVLRRFTSNKTLEWCNEIQKESLWSSLRGVKIANLLITLAAVVLTVSLLFI